MMRMKKLYMCSLGLLALRVSSALESHAKLVKAPKDAVIAGSYIVLMADGPSPSSGALDDVIPEIAGEQRIKHEYNAVFSGYSLVDVSDSLLIDILDSPGVKEVHEDVSNALDPNEDDNEVDNEITQTGAVWGLDRIDSRTGLDGDYNYALTGDGVVIFIVDSGVLPSHSEYFSRYLGCTDYTGEGCAAVGDHGTHVAGTAAGTTYGVAKDASLYDMKVCDLVGTSCPTSAIVAALDQITRWKRSEPSLKYVANLSLSGPKQPVWNRAMASAVNAGVVVVVAAGNDNTDACSASPASEPSVISVGSISSSDFRSSFSNFGTCLDLFAPGSSVLSSSNTGFTTFKSGTSMASPHVAGIAAVMLEQGVNPYQEIIGDATVGAVFSKGAGSPNRLAYSSQFATPNPTAMPTDPPTPFPTPAPTPEPPSSCFSEMATIPVLGEGPVGMANLKIGDKVMTRSGYQPIYGFAHHDTTTMTEFLAIYFTNNNGKNSHDDRAKRLEMTGEHLVHISGKVNPVRADSIKVGDVLQAEQSDGATVTKISTVQRPGLYAPLTPDGTLVVDGIVASCYVSFQTSAPEHLELQGTVGNTSIGSVTFLSQHNYCHMGLALARIACIGVSPQLCNTYTDSGVSHIVQVGFTVTNFGLRQTNVVVQGSLLILFLLVCGPFLVLESILGPTMTCRVILGLALLVVTGVSQARSNKRKGIRGIKEA